LTTFLILNVESLRSKALAHYAHIDLGKSGTPSKVRITDDIHSNCVRNPETMSFIVVVAVLVACE